MSRKARFTPEEKERAVIDYLDKNKSRIQICEELCISSRTIKDWAAIYNRHGIAGFAIILYNRSMRWRCVSMALPGTPGQRISDLCNGNHIT